MKQDRARIYTQEELALKQVVGRALSMLDQVLVFERAAVSHKHREQLKLSNQEFEGTVVAQRNWLINRVIRATLADELAKRDSRFSRKVAEALAQLEVKLADRLVAERLDEARERRKTVRDFFDKGRRGGG